MPPLARPAMMPSLSSATAFTALASVTMEKTISDFFATAHGVSAQAIPALMSGSALSRDRFQPVTRCPAFIKRGTINCPTLDECRASSDRLESIARQGCAAHQSWNGLGRYAMRGCEKIRNRLLHRHRRQGGEGGRAG